MPCRAVLVGLGLALTLAMAPGVHAQGRIRLVDRIVAVVNNEVVTASELSDRVALAMRELRRQGTPLPEAGVLERQMLERLILDKAQLQLARDSGLRVDEVQLDRAIERIAESNKLTLLAFRQALERDGVEFDRFREDLRQQIALNRLHEREVDDKIQVNDSEIDLFLAETTTEGTPAAGVEYNLVHVLVRLPEQAACRDRACARAPRRLSAKRRWRGSSAISPRATRRRGCAEGGAMGWRPQNVFPRSSQRRSRTVRRGEQRISQPGRISRAQASMARNERRLGRGAGVADTRPPYPGEDQRGGVETDARRRLSDLRERIVTGGANFAELARLHSEDGSATRGGDLDWVYPGDTVPEFERMLNELKPGELSVPFKSQFGWHLVQVLERRTADVSVERRRLMARQALKERKSDEAYQDWVRQVRDRAYVEIRFEER